MADEDNHKSKVHPEMLVGVSAVIIGICALGVSLYETSLMREEQRAAVMPLLELSRSYNLQTDDTSTEKSRLWLQARNVGIGPARVANFQVTVDGKPQPTWDAAMRERIIIEFDRLDFEACFCSIFDECWTTSYSAFGATNQVESCQRLDSSFTE